MASEHHKTTSICVLGGSGFIGRHLLDRLRVSERYKVKILLHNSIPTGGHPDHIRFAEGDIGHCDSLIRFLEPNAVVVNLVYLSTSSADDNIRAMDNLAQACINAGVARLIHCSTAVVVGDVKDNVITEEIQCFPATIYEKTKLKIENLLRERLKGKCELIIVRPTAVIGPHGKNGLKLIEELVSENLIVRMLKTSLFAKRRMNLVSVSNVVEAILFLAQFDGAVTGQCFIVSDDDDEENNYFDVARLIALHLGLSPVRMVTIPFQKFVSFVLLKLLRGSNVNPNRVYSGKKLAQMGFTKKTSLRDEIKRFSLWYKADKSNSSSVSA